SVPRCTGSLITLPGPDDLLEHPLGNLGRKISVLLSHLHQLIEVSIGNDCLVLDESLAHEVERAIVKVFTGKGRSIYLCKTAIMPVNPMLFYQLHRYALYFPYFPCVVARYIAATPR